MKLKTYVTLHGYILGFLGAVEGWAISQNKIAPAIILMIILSVYGYLFTNILIKKIKEELIQKLPEIIGMIMGMELKEQLKK